MSRRQLPALPSAFSDSSMLTSSAVEKKRTRLPMRTDGVNAQAGGQVSLAGTRSTTNTTLWAESMNFEFVQLTHQRFVHLGLIEGEAARSRW